MPHLFFFLASSLWMQVTITMQKIHIFPFYIAFGWGNKNTNFGGCLHKGADMFIPRLNKAWMILWKMLTVLPIFCTMLAVQIASDVLSIDVEVIVMKLFSYFNTYTIWIEWLKDFCDFFNWHSVFFISLAFRNSLTLFNKHSCKSSQFI